MTPGKLSISGLAAVVDRINEMDLVFVTTPSQWGRNVPDTFHKVPEMIAREAAALVVTREQAQQLSVPLLCVKNTRLALEQIALSARDISAATRVLITGTQGKTTCKLLLGDLIARQSISVCYSSSSANLDVPVLLSLGNLNSQHKVCLVEAAISEPDVGKRRSEFIQPHMCVFTNANPCHIGTHGNIERVISDKSEGVIGLQDQGVVVLNRESQFFPQLQAAVAARRPDAKQYTYGCDGESDARLLRKEFSNGRWRVQAEILGVRYDYELRLFHAHAPASTLGPLLCVGLLGLDVEQAASDIGQFDSSYQSMGRRITLGHRNGPIVFYDQHYSSNEYALLSAIDDVATTDCVGRRIAVLGGFADHGRFSTGAYSRIAAKLTKSGLDVVYTYGKNASNLRHLLQEVGLHGDHFWSTNEVSEHLFSILDGGDVLLLKAQGTTGFSKVSQDLLNEFPVID